MIDAADSQELLNIMHQLRSEGWCVVLKCLPETEGWIMEGGMSEYDAPSETVKIGVGTWCFEATDVTWPNNRYRHSAFVLNKDPLLAAKAVQAELLKRSKDDGI